MKKIKKYDIYISKLYLYITKYALIYIAEMFFFLLWKYIGDAAFLISNVSKPINW